MDGERRKAEIFLTYSAGIEVRLDVKRKRNEKKIRGKEGAGSGKRPRVKKSSRLAHLG